MPAWTTSGRSIKVLRDVPAITDVFTLGFRSTVRGQLVANTFHVRQNPTAGAVDADHLVALLADSNTDTLVTKYRAILPTEGTLDYLVARLVPDPQFPDDPRAEAARTIGSAGTYASAGAAPTEACLVLSLGTDVAGRRYRGRVFLPPFDDRTIMSGEDVTASGTYWTNLTSFLAELAKTMYPSGAGHYGGAWNDNDLCIYSLKARTEDVGAYMARVTAAVRRPRIHWLRSRGPTV